MKDALEEEVEVSGILEKMQKGYTPFLITFVFFVLALLYAWIRKPTKTSQGKTQEFYGTKILAFLGMVLGSTLRIWEMRAIAIGKSSQDGLPGVGPQILMAAVFLLAHTYMMFFRNKRSEELNKQECEVIMKEVRSTILLLILIVVFAIVEAFLRY